jgi:hypothetical protein
MDMMHPVLVALPPKSPTELAFDTGTMTLSWKDDSITETAFVVEKLVNGVWTQVDQQDRILGDPNVTGEVLSYQDLSFVAGDQYRVLAQNTVGDTWDYSNPGGNEIVPGPYAFPVVTAKSEWVYFADQSGVAAPSNLMATAVSSAQVDLAWTDNATNEDGFVIERSDDLGATWNQVGVPTAADVTTFSDTTVNPASTYQYRVYAFNISGNSLPSNVAEVTTPDVPPAAPTLLMTTAVTSSQVDLAWTDNATSEDGFVIERSNDLGVTWNQVGQTATDVVTFSDTTVVPGKSYMYQVYAFNNATGNSTLSNSVQADTPNVVPADPTNLTAPAVASTQVDLAWTDNANNEDGFRIERSDDGGATWNQVGASTAPDVTTFSDATVAPASSYMYRVYAFNVVGNSGYSNVVSVTTTTGIPPAAPSNLNIINYTQSSLTLNWTDNSAFETGFRVQIATDKNFTQNLRTDTVSANVTTYQFTLLAPNMKYYMRVAAFNTAGSSPWSLTLADKTLK